MRVISLIKKSNSLTVLFLFLFCNLMHPRVVSAQVYPYKFNYLTVDEGLSHTDANDIAQDNKGYIWVATYFGLDRFDGYAIKKFYNDNEPTNNAFKNRLMCVSPDAEGTIWLGTEGGLQSFDPKTEKYTDFTELKKRFVPTFRKIFKTKGQLVYGFTGEQLKLYIITGKYLHEESLQTPKGVQFSDIAPDQNGNFYLSSNKGLWMLDKARNFKSVNVTGLTNPRLSIVNFDGQHNLLVGSGSRLFLTRQQSGSISSPAKSFIVSKQFACADSSDIRTVTRNNNSDYWINTTKGLFRLSSDLHLIQTITNKSALHSLNSNSLTKLFIDRSECLWVCTFGGGVNYCDLNQKLFYTLQHNPEVSNSLAGNHIRSVLADGENLWIGTTANGLNQYNLKTQIFTYYNTYNSPVKLKKDIITALTFDNNHNLWIGSIAGIEILKPDGRELWRPPGYAQFPTYPIDVLAKDCYGNIWFGNHTDKFGVIWKDKLNTYHVKYYGEGFSILADKENPQLFISSTHGLKRIIIDEQGNIKQTISYTASLTRNSLSSSYVYPVSKQNDSTYWIGTMGGGLDRLTLDPDTAYAVKTFAGNYGVFNDVESLQIDNSGNIWMGGNGLECLNPKTGRLIRYDKNDGLQGNSFKVAASAKGADGRLYFGGINGLNYFYPDQIRANTIPAKPVLTDILINNQKPVYRNLDSSTNKKPQTIGYSETLTFNYLQNNFVIFFSAMHFANPLKCKYRYKLLGFDKDWKFTDGENPRAAYSNLDYNSYRFIVQATNNDGMWSDSRAETEIVITPPWWKSTFAKAFYALLVILSLALVYIYQARWYRLKRDIEVRAVNEEKREEMHNQREELYQQQLMFFTNVSHEFRTPLTLILGPLEGLISQNKNSALDYSYQLMYRNAKRLINLIGELMNFKKVADSIVKLKVQPLVINQFCKDLAWEFQNLAISKGIKFKITDHTERLINEPLTGPFDVQVLEKILFNLLNNSFKYTNSGGRISFDIFTEIDQLKPSFNTGFQLLNKDHRAKKYIYFRVLDSGIGISDDSITRIFDRYYRISKNHLGSGVGLAMVKSLTELHKGDIYVRSERYKGTEIIIGLPWGEENYLESEKAASGSELETQLEIIDHNISLPLPDHQPEINPAISKIRKYVLIVDDNEELRAFLKHAFEPFYYIYEAEDGYSAIEVATEKGPDLIISDVMMPGMDGIELCKIIKEKFETSHIPFIILSAKDALDTKIEGMESGADYYFAKPLSIDLLLLTVHNIFEQSEKLKLRYTNDYLSEATELVHSQKDKEFFQKLLDLIEENIKDPDMDVDFLCKNLYTSRTKLYQKIKSISDQSVGDFIRTIRLKKAIQIMTHEDIAMNEVVDRIGFQSSSNFSRAFKKEYGKSPLQFMQSLKKNSTSST
jgi:signal transduction histidine kinase/ligand-binding sensor domain-containing protein/CheY-like chemotaxis protein/AraC-like DNA-binding protein